MKINSFTKGRSLKSSIHVRNLGFEVSSILGYRNIEVNRNIFYKGGADQETHSPCSIIIMMECRWSTDWMPL